MRRCAGPIGSTTNAQSAVSRIDEADVSVDVSQRGGSSGEKVLGLAVTLVALGCGIWFALKIGIIKVEHYPDQVMSDEWLYHNLRRDDGQEG